MARRRSFKAWLSGQRSRDDSVGEIARTIFDDTRILMGAPNAQLVRFRLNQYGLLSVPRDKALQKAYAEWSKS